jgi:hypothetical protein
MGPGSYVERLAKTDLSVWKKARMIRIFITILCSGLLLVVNVFSENDRRSVIETQIANATILIFVLAYWASLPIRPKQ